jgi:hypothetical protein
MSSSVPLYSFHGTPVGGSRPAGKADGSRPAPPGGTPYVGRNRCIANNDTCKGPRAKGTNYCMGHLRSMEKKGESES